jgi:RHS repeat-associated protein
MQYEIPDSFCYGLPNAASSYCASSPTPPSTGLTYGILMGNPTQIDEYDYDGSLKRTTVTVWQRGGNFQANSGHILDRPQTRTVTDPVNSVNAVTSYSYDSTGNPLSVTRSGTGVSPLVAHYAWDSYGNLTQATDPKGNVTTYGYTDSWADASCTPSSTTYGFLTTTTNANNQTTSYQNYSCSGLEATATDPNGLVTTFSYDDHDRLVETDYPDGGYTRSAFVDIPPQSATTTQLIDELGRTKVSTVLLDGLTRKVQSQLTSDPQGTDYIDTAYDPLERVATVSNPYRSTSDSTYGVTTHNYDPLNRPTLVVQPDGSAISTSYCGKAALVTDESGKWRRSQTDALGRLIEVDEPNSLTATVSACPASGDPIWATTYTYDGFDDLTGVAQGGSNPRAFTYDAFHRLTQATNPETGQVTYAYDADNNVVTKTDARGAVGTYTYDPLNRLLSQSFTPDGDLGATFNYDETNCYLLTQCENIGHMTSIIDQGGSEGMAYDLLDHLAFESRVIGGIAKFSAYLYNYDHSIAALLYPSGTVVDYTVDSAGRPSVAQDGSTGTDYVQGACANGLATNGVCYGPQGAASQMLNGTSLTTTTIYNNRLQPCWIYATTGTSLSASTPCTGPDSTPGSVLDLQYNYNWATQDNGNVFGITNNRDTTRSQTFAYDQVNRISTAETISDSGSSQANCWGESYTYDQWGNILAIASPGAAYNGCTQETTHTWQFTGNQISTAGYQYDAAGNMLSDGLNAYQWYSEGSLASADGQYYMYDGRGNRVGKVGSKLYWYGPGGQVLDESDTSGNITDEYVYFGGGRVAHLSQPDSTVYYYAEDHLESSRAMVQDGQTDLCYDADFYPFGGERPYTETCSQNYKFSGKERDTESGNDYFGARYYASTMGRFMSPDWASDPTAVPYANFGDPQSLNLYGYTRNNPLRATDPDGHCDGPGRALSVIQAVQQFAANPGEYLHAFVAGAAKQQLSTALSNWGVTPGPALSPSNDVERAGAAAITTGVEVGAAVILPLANVGEGGGAAPETFMGPKEGSSGGEGAGQPFSPETKQSAVDENAAANGGAARCVYCGQKVTNESGPNTVNIDHSDAKSKGGNDTLNNAQVTCQHCNPK